LQRSRGAPDIRIDGPRNDRGSKSHIYPPAPAPTAPPYPTPGQGAFGGAVVAMPPDAPYPIPRGGPNGPNRRPLYRSEYSDSGDSDYSDRDDRDRRHRHRHYHSSDERGLRRSHSEYGPRHRSKSRHRSDKRDRSDNGRSLEESRKHHITATVTGAVAGGFLGREASKGDMLATVAGALAGAFTANVAERGWERHNRDKEDRWEEKWGYRS
jgi:hypothetical protein